MVSMRIKGERLGLGKWVFEHRFLLIVIPCSLIIVASATLSTLVLVGAFDEPVAEEPEPEPIPDPKPIVRYFSRLTGLPVASKELLNSPATCVMVENSTAARPQSGLRNAGVVYEAIAEGGITRFTAVYQEHDLPALIGPVRSVRLHFVQWLKQYQCAVAHVGGAGDALALVKSAGFRDIDQFYNSNYYSRTLVPGRYGEHSVYTTADWMKAINVAKGFGASEFVGFSRAIGGKLPTRSGVPATAINMKISSGYWNVSYGYYAPSNCYLRSHESGGAHMDRDVNAELVQNSPKVVVAVMVTEELREGGPYWNQVVLGSGVAHVFQNGEYIAATWTKSSIDSELEFRDATGKPIVFVPGQVWISAVNVNRAVTWQ